MGTASPAVPLLLSPEGGSWGSFEMGGASQGWTFMASTPQPYSSLFLHFHPSAWALCSPLAAFLKEPLPAVLCPCASLAWICG